MPRVENRRAQGVKIRDYLLKALKIKISNNFDNKHFRIQISEKIR